MTQANENINKGNFEEITPAFGKTEMPYQVPAGYFDSFADHVLSNIRLADFPTANIFTVPAGYFEHFADSVLRRIENESQKDEIVEELLEFAPLLATISRQNVYSVPAGYFENFTVKKEGKGRVVAMEAAKKKSTWKGLAVAATLLAAVLTLGFVFDRESAPASATKPKAAYASVEGVERDTAKNSQNIGVYLNNPPTKNEVKDTRMVIPQDMNIINVSNEINTISSKDLEDYLNNTPAIN